MQGFHQAVYACAARDIHTVYVFNHSDRDLTDYLERLKKAIDKEDVKVVQCKAVEELVRNSDIICTTTPSTTPVLPDDKELLRGKCIIAIGSYMPRITMAANHVISEKEVQEEQQYEQMNLFTDFGIAKKEKEEKNEKLEREKKMQKAMLDIKKKYGKNAILKGMNLQEDGTAMERNRQIGGHKA